MKQEQFEQLEELFNYDIPSYLKNNVWPEENPYRNCDLVQ